MLATRYYGAGDVRVEEVPEPDGPGPREVVVAPRWCGICGTDLHEYAGGPIVTAVEPHPLTGARLPQIMGHEFAGDVLDVGAEVRHVAPGDRVSVMPLIYCGRCFYCVRGLNHLCERMACTGLSAAWGGFAERAVLRDYQVARLPDSVSYEAGALIEPAAVAVYGVARGGVSPGDRVLVAGGGPIGALAGLAAQAAGAAEVLLSEPNAGRAAAAQALGFARVFDPRGGDVVEQIRDHTGGLGVDVAIECAGSADALNACIAAARRAGRVVQTGLHTRPASVEPELWALNDLTISGTWCYPVHDWPRLLGLVAAGRLPLERVVTDRIGQEQIVARGFDALLDPDGAQVKVLVAPDGVQ
jgi:(R,R)-butanediol dehydrogenase / meso-butanediol dehydrogenase / diacetyl reductase